jgi:adenylylsulfate kinase
MTDHIYASEHPETTHVRPGGFTLWFTGLSGSGKTTIAHLVGPELDRRGLVVEYLDGDNVRMHLSKGLGFSKEDRDTHVERVGWVASRITRQGGAVITAAISPYAETRQQARDWVEPVGTFVEVYIKASVDECARRDVKGLYEKAFKGEIKEFTGVSDPYEEPTDPELVVVLGHEALERRQRSRGEHVQVGELARGQRHDLEGLDVVRPFSRPVDERAAVRRDQLGLGGDAHTRTAAGIRPRSSRCCRMS